MVIHQWPTVGENAIVAMYYPNPSNYAVFGIYSSALGGYQDYVYFDASHTFTLCIQPEYSTGYTSYDEITFYVYDNDASTLWSNPYSIGWTEYIKDVDYALEQNDAYDPNGNSCFVYNYFALDKDFGFVDLDSCFTWLEWENEDMVNHHSESFNGNYAYLSQWKWYW
jgi:hypothetical protein